ncbi:MmoB/DmpM family protein [Halarcobacter sp.]|uniref:MmoB/DmpM family protein n=1 Tax=Halarcobacter sp. TaxID=2321133 RepID=UPI002AA73730|nr:MmoB/DmpM family protein [Halarcobacter sp.]
MAENNVLLVLQDVEEARPIVQAVQKDNINAIVENQPAMIRITCPDRLVINAETMEEIIGREWDPQELQLCLITLAGNVDEDYDHFIIYWDN